MNVIKATNKAIQENNLRIEKVQVRCLRCNKMWSTFYHDADDLNSNPRQNWFLCANCKGEGVSDE